MATTPEQHVIAHTDFTIVIEGPAVSLTYPLFGITSILLSATTALRDSAADVVIPLLKPTDRVEIDLQAGFPRQGSYIQDIAINFVTFVQQNALPLILAIPIPEIVKHANETLELAERVRNFIRRVRHPEVEKIEKGNIVLSGGDKEQLSIPEQSLKSIEPTFRLFSELDQNRLRSVEIRTTDGSRLKIRYEAAERISPEEFKQLKSTVRRLTNEAKHGGRAALVANEVAVLPLEAPPLTVRGNIRELDFDSRTGRFRVLEKNPIPPGTYPFELSGEQSLNDIKSLLGETTVLVDCVAIGRGKKRRLTVISVRRVG